MKTKIIACLSALMITTPALADVELDLYKLLYCKSGEPAVKNAPQPASTLQYYKIMPLADSIAFHPFGGEQYTIDRTKQRAIVKNEFTLNRVRNDLFYFEKIAFHLYIDGWLDKSREPEYLVMRLTTALGRNENGLFNLITANTDHLTCTKSKPENFPTF